jgi:hypothetical protein
VSLFVFFDCPNSKLLQDFLKGVGRDNAREESGEMPPNAGGGGAKPNGKPSRSVDCFFTACALTLLRQ